MRSSDGGKRRYSPARRGYEENRVIAIVISEKWVYNPPMDTLSLAPAPTSSGEDFDSSLEADIQRLDTMVPQMAAAAKAAQVDAQARIAALHARIAQDITILRKSEACVPSSQ